MAEENVVYKDGVRVEPAKPVINDAVTPKPLNILDQLRAELSKKVARPEIFIEVPERPGMVLRISPNVTNEQLKGWRRNAGENSKAGLDSVKFATFVIIGTTTGIYLNDELVTNEAGTALLFGDDEIMTMTKADRVSECVRRFFEIEPHIEATAVTILDHAGYGDEVKTVDVGPPDPSKGS